ncbi:MAG: Hsp20 family protein [Rhodobiaceae bacterium]|nr:Hsp20 family protein [Rhodobiaceae bacterium]MCC0015502.1 Hsp20 family protein [Rhodobiaceae bacterium]MCC0040932.1 Hsp20 family protein [Rhodobiaceae bacterium]MCC0053259.1 Hsp20 family protein [Rhodobiaceae bacterium]
MRHIDLSPLYRSTVGFDRMFSLLDSLTSGENGGNGYPPYNIERTGENAYRITMAVAGFAEGDLDIQVKEGTLSVRGDKSTDQSGETAEMLYRGIAERSFERRFQLADHVEVRGASLANGLLHIDLVREIPEAMKPRSVKIESAGKGKSAQTIEHKAGETEAKA